MKRLTALSCALALSVPALAQVPAGTDPALTHSVRELLIHMKLREQLMARLQQAAQAIPQTLQRAQAERINANKNLTDEQKKAELAIVGNDVQRVAQEGQRLLSEPKLADELLDRVVPLYAAKFTQAEVNELLGVYKTPAMAKMLELTPPIMAEANQLIGQAVKERMMAAVAARDPRRK